MTARLSRAISSLIPLCLGVLLSACGDDGAGPAPAASPGPLTSAIPFTARIGAATTEVTFPAAANGLFFYRAAGDDCDLANYTLCPGGALDPVVAGVPLQDSTFTGSSDAAWYWLSDGSSTSRATLVSTHTLPRLVDHGLASFQGRLWAIGGRDITGGVSGAIWRSADGVTWQRVTSAAQQSDGSPAFANVEGAQLRTFKDRLWLIGGKVNGSASAGIWVSADGITWDPVTPQQPDGSPAFGRRAYHQVVERDGRLWLFGGEGPDSPYYIYKDVWASDDGATWERVTDAPQTPAGAPALTGMDFHAIAVWQGDFWLLGGYGSESYDELAGVWRSPDGIVWTQITAAPQQPDGSPAFGAVDQPVLAVVDGRLWLTGGYGQAHTWSTADGAVWRQEISDSGATYGASLAYHDDRLFWIGAHPGEEPAVRVLDSGRWTAAGSNTAAFPARSDFALFSFNGQLWHGFGFLNSGSATRTRALWRSSDGHQWSLATADPRQSGGEAAFPDGLSQTEVVTFNGKVWAVGGRTGSGKTEVWNSTDGVTWDLVTDAPQQADGSPALSFRVGAGVVVFANRIWVIGGNIDARTPSNEVWASADGVIWELVTGDPRQPDGSPAFSPRFSAQAVVHDGRIWLVGGRSGSLVSSANSEVWRSTDGLSWTLVTAAPLQPGGAPAFDKIFEHRMLAFANRLWVFKGYGNSGIWSSADGQTWTLATDSAYVPNSSGYRAAATADGLYLVNRDDNRVWYSADGDRWYRLYQGVIRPR